MEQQKQTNDHKHKETLTSYLHLKY